MATGQTDPSRVFDRRAVRGHRDRAAPGLDDHNFLFVEAARRLVERLGDVNRHFPRALDLGCHGGEFGFALTASDDRRGVEMLVETDISAAMVARAAGSGRRRAIAAEEALTFAAG